MTDRTWKLAKWSGIGIVAAVVLAVPYLPGRTEPVTRESLESARALWEAAKIADYDFDLVVSGDQSGNYHVEVRGGKVANLTLNGGAAESHAPQYFTIDGLFLTLEEYLDHCENPARAGIPEGSTVRLRMRTDKELGYPIRFVRQVKFPAQRTTTGYQASSGAQDIEFRVTRFDPKAM